MGIIVGLNLRVSLLFCVEECVLLCIYFDIQTTFRPFGGMCVISVEADTKLF